MSWFTSRSKRLKASINQTFYTKEVQEKTREIKDVVSKIQQEATLQTQQTIEATHGQVMKLATAEHLETYRDSIVESIAEEFRVADQNRDLSNVELLRRLDQFNQDLGKIAQKAAIAAVERMMYEHDAPAGKNPYSGLMHPTITADDFETRSR